MILLQNKKVLHHSFETGNTVTSGRFQKNFNWMLSKVMSILLTVYSAKWKKLLSVSKSPEKKKNPLISSSLRSTHSGGDGEPSGWGGLWVGGCWAEKGEGRGRDSPLMSIWWVFSWSRDLFVLLLFPESSIPPSLRIVRTLAQRVRCAAELGLSWPPVRGS